jgi:hypothetical protein
MHSTPPPPLPTFPSSGLELSQKGGGMKGWGLFSRAVAHEAEAFSVELSLVIQLK